MNYPQNIKSFRRWRIHIVAVYIFILNFTILTNGIHQLNPTNLGWIRPSEKIITRVGQHLEIFCGINVEIAEIYGNHFTSENLEFRKDGQLLDSLDITKVNETTISLYLSNESESEHLYECFLTNNTSKTRSSILMKLENMFMHALEWVGSYFINNDEYTPSTSNSKDKFQISIGSIRVTVGGKPKDVLNFRCVLVSGSVLQCFWDVQKNYVDTNYSIQYVPISIVKFEYFGVSLSSSLPNSTVSNNPIKCPDKNNEMNNYCIWSLATKPPYLNIHQELNVTILGVNMFGQVEQSFIFNQYEHAQLQKVSDLVIQDITDNNFTFTFHVDNVFGITRNLFVEIQLCGRIVYGSYCDWLISPNTWTRSSIPCCPASSFVYGLKPYSKYILRIRIKLFQAPDFEEYWSSYSDNMNVSTKPLIPTYVPETGVGLFKTSDTEDTKLRKVVIYWKSIVPSPEYGDFHYEIKDFRIDENNEEQLLINWHKVLAHNIRYSYNLDKSDHHLVIRSANSAGRSPTTSSINIPGANNIVKSCSSFNIIKRDNYNRTYSFECSWQPPKTQLDIVNYTLFWLWYKIYYNLQEIEYSRTMSSWIYLPANITRHQIFVDYNIFYSNRKVTAIKNVYNICISVNTKNSSSGLLCECTTAHSVSHTWQTEWFLRKKNESLKKSSNTIKVKEEVPSKRVTYNGWKFSQNQFQKWMDKLNGIEP